MRGEPVPSLVHVVLLKWEPGGRCYRVSAAVRESAQGCSRMQSRDKRGTGGAAFGVVWFTLLIENASGLNYFQNGGQVLFQREQIHSLQKKS